MWYRVCSTNEVTDTTVVCCVVFVCKPCCLRIHRSESCFLYNKVIFNSKKRPTVTKRQGIPMQQVSETTGTMVPHNPDPEQIFAYYANIQSHFLHLSQALAYCATGLLGRNIGSNNQSITRHVNKIVLRPLLDDKQP